LLYRPTDYYFHTRLSKHFEKMLSNYLISALCMGALASAYPLDERGQDHHPTPTRPFTVKAFQSPFPAGQGLTDLEMHAQNGAFFLNADKPKVPTVLSVNGLGMCALVSVVRTCLSLPSEHCPLGH